MTRLKIRGDAYPNSCAGRRAGCGCNAAPAALSRHVGCQARKGQRQRVHLASEADDGAAEPHGGCQRRLSGAGQHAGPSEDRCKQQKQMVPYQACTISSAPLRKHELAGQPLSPNSLMQLLYVASIEACNNCFDQCGIL